MYSHVVAGLQLWQLSFCTAAGSCKAVCCCGLFSGLQWSSASTAARLPLTNTQYLCMWCRCDPRMDSLMVPACIDCVGHHGGCHDVRLTAVAPQPVAAARPANVARERPTCVKRIEKCYPVTNRQRCHVNMQQILPMVACAGMPNGIAAIAEQPGIMIMMMPVCITSNAVHATVQVYLSQS